ncbi:MAG: hypothetical protein HYX38_10415 [Rhodospirillales bacterium]|nr:hypothetical protein [Rhodospirillales bacterium]
MTRRKVHLVGSVPLADNVEVFHAAAKYLPGLVSRFPDGEVGRRWIMMQRRVAAECPQLEPAASRSYTPGPTYEHFQLKAGVDPASVVFPPLGYIEPAVQSYATFRDLRAKGVLPQESRFLVTFPTPAAFLWCYIRPDQRAAVEGSYLRRLRQEVDEIVDAIPNEDLAIQWDTVHEVLMIEGARDSMLSPEEHIDRLVAVGNYVPAAVELGYHFCYGYAARKHTIEPSDTGLLVDIANILAERVARPIGYVHMPVPRDRSDDAFFGPLARLRLDPGTELYLGLMHLTDGIEGAARRISAAVKAVSRFGISTECGLGTRPPETILPLLKLHAEAAAL